MEKRLLCLLAGLFLLLGAVSAQSRKVTGSVILQEDGEPAIGATVSVLNSKNVAITDIDGKFTIEVPEGGKIKVNYIGMEPQTLLAKEGMTVHLKSNTTLNEVVVTGMSKMDRRTFTGATDQLKADETMISGMNDISRSLEGRSAGVSVQNVSGTFGTAPKIRVRGATSIYGSSKPLWVVDGVIMEDVTDISADALSSGDAETLVSSAIAGLNSDDIESFQILKDGSATSIYGARAMAGVIVVTTKKGRAGQAHINYSGEFTTRLKPSYRNFNILNSQEQMGIYQELKDKGWLNLSTVLNSKNYGVYGKMYELIDTFNPTTGQFELANTQEAQNAYLQGAEQRNTNWFNRLFSNGIMQNHSVSMSGGTMKSNYYASMSAMLDPGWYKDSKVNRYTANLNLTHHILDNLSLNLIGSASYRKQKAPGTMSQDVDVASGEVSRQFDINPFSYALNSSRALDPYAFYVANYAPFNIFNELNNNYIDLNVVDTKFQMELKYSPIRDLELSALGAIKYATTTQEHKVTDNSNQAQAYRSMKNSQVRDDNNLLYKDPDDPYALPISVLPQGGLYQRTDNRMTSYDIRLTANYNHTFNKAHIVNVFGGMEANSIERNQTWFNGAGLQYTKGELASYVYQFFKKGLEEGDSYYGLSNSSYRSAAFFGNATYSYKGKYNVNGTIRYEGTNQFGQSSNAKWLPTWNISGSWNVHEEDFFFSLRSVLSHLTLKASYSLTADRGPADITNSSHILRAYNVYRPFTSDKETGIKAVDFANRDLTYEKKHEFNFGVDAGFLNNRISLTFDIYQRNNYDLIGAKITEAQGRGSIIEYTNIASMKSHGEELSITTKNIQTKDFSWTTNLIYSHAVNEVTDLMTQASTMDYIQGTGFAKKGYPVRALFSIPFIGLDEDGYPTFLNEKGQVTSTDINFQERINNGYLKYEGPTDPTYTGSLGNVFGYKGFHLNIFMTYSFGNVVRLDPVFSAQYNDLSSMTKEFKNRYRLGGDEKYTDVPTILTYRQYHDNTQLQLGYNAYNYSDIRVAKGDFIRMKEISLSYDFPAAWFTHTALKNLSLKLQGTDLFLIYADKKLNGQDPEFFRAGGVSAPLPRQFTLTVKAGF